MHKVLAPWHGEVRSVVGPGRSGAIAAVYASYILKVPMLPQGLGYVPEPMKPTLVVDTASKSGRTLRKLLRRYETLCCVFAFHEPPRVHFWYERRVEP